MKCKITKTSLNILIFLITSIAFLTVGAVFSYSHQLITGLIIVLYAVAAYFYIVFFIAERNWMDIRALFSAAWLGTIGLATLRLTEYQEPWQIKTWILLISAYILFQIFATLGIKLCDKFYSSIKNFFGKFHIGKLKLVYNENRLFLICIVTTLIGLTSFIINVAIKGFIPCFSDSPTAYLTFYTKFHIFSVAATAVSGLCFYCLRTQKLSLTKKIILCLCILYLVFLFPIMVVSRGTFIVAAISLVASIFYTCGKKLWVLCLSLVLIMGIYMSVSLLRNYTDAQLDVFFEPADIEIDMPDEDEEDNTTSNPTTIKLPPKMAFLYSYFTVSHDNFNLAVKKTEGYTYGARQFYPFNVILRIDSINDISENGEFHLVRPHLNTINLFGDAYYDFHEIGVILFAIFWSLIFGFIQEFYKKSKDAFSLLILGNSLVPVILCFFSSWLSNFTQWMLWGTAFLMFIACTVTIIKKESADK